MALVNYTPTNWNGTQRVTPSSQNKFENGINDCANAINELDESQKDMITEVKMNGTSIKGVNGVADIGTVITSVQSVTGGSAYNPSTSYHIGDCCIKNNVLYECITSCVGIEPPDATYWRKVDLATLNNNLSNMLLVKEYEVTVEYTAGTIGTRGFQGTTNVKIDGYTPIGLSLTYVGGSISLNPVVFFSGSKELVYSNAYRASTNSVDGNTLRFQVLYISNNIFSGLASALSEL